MTTVLDVSLQSTRDEPVWTTPLMTSAGKPMTWYVDEQIIQGRWRQEIIPGEVLGLSRSLSVFRAPRKTDLIAHKWHGDRSTFCPPTWWDLAIGSGACGLGCQACFLILTHRIKRDPWRHLLYDNVEDFAHAVEKWLHSPDRRRQHTLGVGIDRSDSLLYEGVVGHARRLAPLFGDPIYNPAGCKLILLTKSKNTQYLAEIPPEYRHNIVVSFSLNPELVADLWEGKWPDGVRITPSIADRLEAARLAQDLGFEVRIRLDPILTPPGWPEYYADFVAQVGSVGVDFRYWTLGTYREKNTQLDAWRERWGLSRMGWQPQDDELSKDGTHLHLLEERRLGIYRTVGNIIRDRLPHARISVCKETHSVRKTLSLCNAACNCLL